MNYKMTCKKQSIGEESDAWISLIESDAFFYYNKNCQGNWQIIRLRSKESIFARQTII